tara:strand:- start:20219 stop:20509 length:291 start_codon:yes stop_codon:yes gene_type:complete
MTPRKESSNLRLSNHQFSSTTSVKETPTALSMMVESMASMMARAKQDLEIADQRARADIQTIDQRAKKDLASLDQRAKADHERLRQSRRIRKSTTC